MVGHNQELGELFFALSIAVQSMKIYRCLQTAARESTSRFYADSPLFHNFNTANSPKPRVSEVRKLISL